MLFFACEPPHSGGHHTRSHCIYSKGPLPYSGLCDPEYGQWTQLGTLNDPALTIVRAVIQVTFFYFCCQMDCRVSWYTSSLLRKGVCYCPVSSAPYHVDVSCWSTFSELPSFVVPGYKEYTPWKLPQKKNISVESRSRVTFYLLFWTFYKVKAKWSTTKLESSKEVPSHIHAPFPWRTACGLQWAQNTGKGRSLNRSSYQCLCSPPYTILFSLKCFWVCVTCHLPLRMGSCWKKWW